MLVKNLVACPLGLLWGVEDKFGVNLVGGGGG